MQRDIAFVITSYLNNLDLEKVYLSGLILNLNSLVVDQNWWYERIRTLIGSRILRSIETDYRSTYQTLELELSKSQPSFCNRDDNVTALRLLTEWGFAPSQSDVRQAVQMGLKKTLSYLIRDLKVEIVTTTRWQEPIILAAENGEEEAVMLSLTIPCCWEARWGNESGNYSRIVEALIEADVDNDLDYRVCAECIAEYDDNAEILSLILPRLRQDQISWANWATVVEKKRYKMLRMLLQDERFNPNDVLDEAILTEDEKILDLVLSHPRISLVEHDNEILKCAMRNNKVKAVDLLLARPEIRQELDYGRIRRSIISPNISSGILELLEAAEEGAM